MKQRLTKPAAIAALMVAIIAAVMAGCTYKADADDADVTREVFQVVNDIADTHADKRERDARAQAALGLKRIADERKEAESAEPDEEPAPVDETYYDDGYYYEPASYAPANSYGNDFQSQGVVYDGGTTYTWYSQRTLPGAGLTELNSNGRTVNDDGFVTDGEGYIAVSSSDYAKGTVLDTPFGAAKVYDTGCPSGVVDVYTDF